jgi:hypothetical protein
MDAQAETWMREALAANHGVVLDTAVSVIESVGEEATPDHLMPSVRRGESHLSRASARIEHIKQSYTMDAARSVEKATGIDANLAAHALYESRHAPGIRELSYQHLHEGKANWAPVVQDWAAGFAETPEGRAALLAANQHTGIVRMDGDKLLVRLSSGEWTDWANAVRTK